MRGPLNSRLTKLEQAGSLPPDLWSVTVLYHDEDEPEPMVEAAITGLVVVVKFVGPRTVTQTS